MPQLIRLGPRAAAALTEMDAEPAAAEPAEPAEASASAAPAPAEPTPEEAAAAAEAKAAEQAAFRQAELERRAKRAARFGLPVEAPPAPPTPEELAAAAAKEAAAKEARDAFQAKKASRAARFGGDEPAPEPAAAPAPAEPEAWSHPEGMPWSLYKKSLMKQKQGLALATGFDLSSPEEQAKIAARAAKWDPEAAAAKAAKDAEQAREFEARAKRLGRFGVVDLGDAGGAWTKFETLVLKPLKLDVARLYAGDADRSQAERGSDAAMADGEEPPESRAAPPAAERLHLSVLPCDRKAFKKLRSNDLEGHFAAYGATYTEWLGDTSVNVWFADADAAARARLALTEAVPAPPPALLAPLEGADGGLGDRGWRLAKVAKKQNDKWGKAGFSARVLCRFALPSDVLDAKPAYANPDPTKRGGRAYVRQEKKKRRREARANAPPRAAKRGAPMDEDEVMTGMGGGLSASRGGTRDDDDDEDPRAAKRSKFRRDGDDDAPADAAADDAAMAA